MYFIFHQFGIGSTHEPTQKLPVSGSPSSGWRQILMKTPYCCRTQIQIRLVPWTHCCATHVEFQSWWTPEWESNGALTRLLTDSSSVCWTGSFAQSPQAPWQSRPSAETYHGHHLSHPGLVRTPSRNGKVGGWWDEPATMLSNLPTPSWNSNRAKLAQCPSWHSGDSDPDLWHPPIAARRPPAGYGSWHYRFPCTHQRRDAPATAACALGPSCWPASIPGTLGAGARAPWLQSPTSAARSPHCTSPAGSRQCCHRTVSRCEELALFEAPLPSEQHHRTFLRSHLCQSQNN